MIKRLIVLAVALLPALGAFAQQIDSTLVGRDIVVMLGDRVNQSPAMDKALHDYIQTNALKPVQGYRVRVFLDNSTQARTKSGSIETYLINQYPGLGVYRTYESPNYKVTVGDFRTKDDALKIFMALKNVYPTAYIIKESINYPQ